MTLPSVDYRLISLTQYQFAKVDPEDYGWISQLEWFAWRNKHYGFYAQTNQYRGDGERVYVQMHRLIMGLAAGDALEVDHINHDTLDNRRCNLRIVTHATNALNRRIRSDNTSGFKGVSFNKQRQLWQAYINLNRKRFYLGFFSTAAEAGEAYRIAAIRFHGSFRDKGVHQIEL